MANNGSSFGADSGEVRFPRSPLDLTSVTQCPSCFAPLSAGVCTACGLDLNHPEAVEVARLSTDIAGMLEKRRAIIGRIRLATAQALEKSRAAALAVKEAEFAAAFDSYQEKLADAAAAPATTVASPLPPAAPPAAAQSIPVSTATPPPARPSPPAEPATTRPRGSSIQVILLIAGVSLVSLAAVLFIIYAFVNFGIEWRSAIIAGITVATFTIASLLRRRGYTSTAEGIGVFAVVLVYLDAYAVRANNLFGSADADPQVYWGVTLLGSSLGFILWRRLSGLRVPSVAGFAAVAPGLALLVYGLADGVDEPVRLFAAFAAMAVAGLLHPLAARRARGDERASAGIPERSIVLSVASIGLLAALATAFTIASGFWAATIAVSIVALVGAAHALLTLPAARAGVRLLLWFGRGFAVVAAMAASTAFAATLTQHPDASFAMIVPVAAAVAAALALDTLWRRASSAEARGLAGAAAIGALAVAGPGILVPLGWASVPSLTAIADATTLGAWSHGATEALVTPSAENAAAVAALAIVTVLSIAFSAASGTLRDRRVALSAMTGTTTFLAVTLLETTWLVVAGWLVISTVALALAIVGSRRWRFGTGLLRTLAFLAVAALTFGYLASWASTGTWLAASLAAIVLLLAARLAFPDSTTAQAALLGIAIAIAVVGAIALAQEVTLEGRSSPDIVNSVRFVNLLAIGLLALGSVSYRLGLTPADRRTIAGIAFPVATVSAIIVWLLGETSATILPEYGTSLVASCVLLVALVLWIVLRGNADLLGARMTASIGLAPAGFLVVDAFARLTRIPGFADVSSVTSVVLVAAGALVVSILRPSGTPRWSRELGIALVLLPALYLASAFPHEQTWLVLLLGGVTVLLTAISADGLFDSLSGRKHLGWAALALGTAGLWRRLSTDSVSAVEPYVLPVAGLLLIVALLVWRSERREGSQLSTTAAPMIAFGALVVAVLPVAGAGSTGDVTRAIVIGAVSAVLLLAGSLLRGSERAQPYLDAAAVAGALGLLTVTIGRIALSIPLTDARVDAWLGGAAAVLFVAAFGQSRRIEPSHLRSAIGQAPIAVAIATIVIVQLTALAAADAESPALSRVRVLGWAIALALVAVTSLTVNRGPLRLVVGWLAVGGVGILVFSALSVRVLTAVEGAGLLVLLALASSATALVVSLVGASTVPRHHREIGLGLMALLSLAILPANSSEAVWLVLELAAVCALLVAISPDGLFGAATSRKHVGWLALALAVAGLWWRLAGTGVRDVEPYVLPLAGALLLIALLTWRSRAATAAEDRAAPIIVLGALLVAILPIGLNSATGPIERAIALWVASAVLLLAGSVVTRPTRLLPYLNAVAAAGAIGVLVVAIGRSWFTAIRAGTPEVALDAWLGATLAILLLAALGQARDRDEEHDSRRSAIGQALFVAGLSIVLLFEVSAIDHSDLGFARALTAAALFSVVHVVSVAVDAGPFTRLVGWLALGFAVVVSIAGFSTAAFDEIEYASVPVALALIAGGVLRLRQDTQSRSWPPLGPGLLLLVVPSFLAAIDDRPIWRIAAIAVVAIAMTVIGLVARLQAPFIIGAVMTITHTITTFSPQLRELYELHSWLVWIVIGTVGGTLLIVLAARFEKSLTSARSTLRRVGELR